MSSFLIWSAWQRKIPGLSLWPETPFYLASVDDYKSRRPVLEFLSSNLGIDIPLNELDEKIEQQSSQILKLRSQDKDVDRYLGSLEMNISLTQEEAEILAKKLADYL